MKKTTKTTFEIDKPRGGVTMNHMMISTSFADRPSERERWRDSRDFEAFFYSIFFNSPAGRKHPGQTPHPWFYLNFSLS